MWDQEYEAAHPEQDPDQEARAADFARQLEQDLLGQFYTAPVGSSS
ncbi:hypothetical protein A2U01_0094247 [Trifolium medium]|uniref:Uncharacterized protein n=1 Tax=Trifolium medium TaxID=97028 RepID=A0A392UH97_9FABA|nr:hypothetical protein [Trifolium medium]